MEQDPIRSPKRVFYGYSILEGTQLYVKKVLCIRSSSLGTGLATACVGWIKRGCVQAVVDWETPRKVQELRLFLRLVKLPNFFFYLYILYI